MQTSVDSTRNYPWQIFLLGGLRIMHNGQPMHLPPFRCRGLLGLLLLYPSKHKREQLAGQLFPDSPEDTAKARLSDRLWLLKNHLPEFPLTSTATDINIDMEQVWVDVNEFRILIKDIDRPSLTQAISLYAGDLLPEQDEEWLLLERENLYMSYVRSLQMLATQGLRSGEYDDVVILLQKLQKLEPFDESNLRNLMRAYQSVGQRGAALAAFDQFCMVLKNEMGLEPEPATLEIVQAIRTQATPHQRPSLEMNLPDSPHGLFQRGQQALWQGDFHTVQICANTLRKEHESALPGAADSLNVEYALLRGDYVSAEKLLKKHHKDAPFCIILEKIHLLVELRDFSGIVEQCKSAILEAHRRKDRISEMLLLSEQGIAYQRTGNIMEAMRCANQIITQSEKENILYLLALGLLLKGVLQISQGFERDALETFHHAAAYASENGFFPLLARAERKLGSAYQNAGKYRLSLQHYDKALRIARDLGMKRDEAETLQNLAIVLACLGRNEESIFTVREARDIFTTLNDVQGMARNTYHLAFGLALIEDPALEDALALGKQALDIFQKHQSLGWVASVYGMLGYIHWMRNEPDASIEACEKAIPIYQQLEEADYLPEMYGYIGLAYLQKNDPQKALEYTSIAMDEMMRGELYDIASEIYYAHATALDALGQTENANEFFRRGYENLITYASEIEEPDALQTFFRRDPTVRRLMEEVYSRGLAPAPQVETHQVASHGRTSLSVALTMDSGAPDVVLKNAHGVMALRRARLRRILCETRSQGGDPSLEQIASMMNVSLRTIQRDVSYLEDQGELL